MADTTDDLELECCKCGLRHKKSKRYWGGQDSIRVRPLLCPSCGHDEYYEIDGPDDVCTTGLPELGEDEE